MNNTFVNLLYFPHFIFDWHINLCKHEIFIIHLREKWFIQKDLFFHGIEESVIRFSVRCKENELHRKHKDFAGPTQNAPPILKIDKIDASIGFSTTQSV